MQFRCKNLLVTGGNGFIGSNYIDYTLKKYSSVNIYNIDKLTYAGLISNTDSFNSNQRYNFIKGDICDTNLVLEIFKKYNIDGVINFAAESHVDNSIKNPKIFINTNVNGVFNLLNACYKNWMSSPFEYKPKFSHSRFHQISTDEVFGSILNVFLNRQDYLVCFFLIERIFNLGINDLVIKNPNKKLKNKLIIFNT